MPGYYYWEGSPGLFKCLVSQWWQCSDPRRPIAFALRHAPPVFTSVVATFAKETGPRMECLVDGSLDTPENTLKAWESNCGDRIATGYRPLLVAGTGTDNNLQIATVLEERTAPPAFVGRYSSTQDWDAFKKACKAAANASGAFQFPCRPRSITAVPTDSHGSMALLCVWERNVEPISWGCSFLRGLGHPLLPSEWEEGYGRADIAVQNRHHPLADHIAAYGRARARPALIVPLPGTFEKKILAKGESVWAAEPWPSAEYLVVWRDDLLAPSSRMAAQPPTTQPHPEYDCNWASLGIAMNGKHAKRALIAVSSALTGGNAHFGAVFAANHQSIERQFSEPVGTPAGPQPIPVKPPIASPKSAPLSVPTTYFLDGALKDLLRSRGAHSAELAIVRDGQLVYARAQSLQEPFLPATLGEKSPMRVASVSKVLTALAVMRLHEQHKLNFWWTLGDVYAAKGETLRRIDGKTSTNSLGKLKIEDLLRHRSGLRAGKDYPVMDEMLRLFAKLDPGKPRQADKLTRDEVVQFMASLEDSYLFEFALQATGGTWLPGTAIQGDYYSNWGYVLLGHILELVTGEKYEQVVAQQVFEPLGMPHQIGTKVNWGPRLASSDLSAQGLGEPFYYRSATDVGMLSTMRSDCRQDRGIEPETYGRNFGLWAPSDGWSLSVVDLARILADFHFLPGHPKTGVLFKTQEVLDLVLPTGGAMAGQCSYAGMDVGWSRLHKSGAEGGTRCRIDHYWDVDGAPLSIAAIVAGDWEYSVTAVLNAVRDTGDAAAKGQAPAWPQDQFPHYFPQGYAPPKLPPGSKSPGS
ncbi:MAG: beta-lactamase family protein [Deltaproteobacteria bacterium]|nr:beta-lactamase family protein [Deltaproteobacteria bacterium]